MKILSAFLVVAVLLQAVPAYPADSDMADSAALESIMSSLLSLQYAAEHPVMDPLTDILFGDVNGDGEVDAVLTYGQRKLEGVNSETFQRIAVFISERGGWKLRYDAEVGSMNTRVLSAGKIEGGRIRFVSVSCKSWASGNCPESVSERWFQWTTEGLIEP